AGENPLLQAALDHKFVAEVTRGSLQRGAVGSLDARSRLGLKNLLGALANDVVAGKSRKALERPIGEDITSVLDVLGSHANRNIFEHRFQELLGRGELSRKLALLAAILVCRHRSAAIGQLKMLDQNRTASRQFENVALGRA